MNEFIKEYLTKMTKRGASTTLRKKYHSLICSLNWGGVYIWGNGRLGRFAHEQCKKNKIIVHGFIDNDVRQINVEKQVYGCDQLKSIDNVIIASMAYADIAQQLCELGIFNFIYYEELALASEEFDIYYPLFKEMHEELEEAREEYIRLYDIFDDTLSKEIYTDLILYRMSLDIKYTKDAYERSLRQGIQDFDQVIVNRLNSELVFYDVGGFDGTSTLDFIAQNCGYRKIYFFEPDEKIMEQAKQRLDGIQDIVFVQAGAGETNRVAHYHALGNGAGKIARDGAASVQIVALDDYIESGNVYVKMDVEGYEMQVLYGMKQAIMKYKPMLAVSVYHKSGDIHRLTKTILSWNPGYRVYMRHYTNVYADTVCYFIDERK